MNTDVLLHFNMKITSQSLSNFIANSPKASSSKQKIDNDRDVILSSLYIYHLSIVVDFSSEKCRGSTGHRNSWYQ